MLFRPEESCVFPLVLQAANAAQQKLESEVAIFLSMVKNEENGGRRMLQSHVYSD